VCGSLINREFQYCTICSGFNSLNFTPPKKPKEKEEKRKMKRIQSSLRLPKAAFDSFHNGNRKKLCVVVVGVVGVVVGVCV